MNPDRVGRRPFIRVIAGAALGLGAEAVFGPRTANSQVRKPANPKFQAPVVERGIAEIIANLDREVVLNPDRLNSIAPDISEMAARVIGRETGRDWVSIRENQKTEENDDFRKAIDLEDGCNKPPPDSELVFGLFVVASGRSHINLSRIKGSIVTGNLETPTRLLYAISMHEGLHQIVKPVKLDPPAELLGPEGKIVKADIRKGISLVYPSNQIEDEAPTCMNIWWADPEEGIFEQAVTHWLRRDAINYRSPGYFPQMIAYQTRVIDQLFKGEFQPQLQLYVDTETDKFLGNIGARVKEVPIFHMAYPNIKDDSDRDAGETFLFRNIPPVRRDPKDLNFHQAFTHTSDYTLLTAA